MECVRIGTVVQKISRDGLEWRIQIKYRNRMSKIKDFLDNPVYFITSPAAKGYLDFLSDEAYLKLLYRATMGRRLDLKNPKLYNEKLQWLKLNDRKDIYHKMVDKYEVRQYIADTIGKQYLIECFGVYDSVEDIDPDALPERFVLKCTHDSGSVEICKDRSSFDAEAAFQRLSQAMNRKYYSTYREWPYKGLTPRIIAEEYLEDEEGDLKDYKIMCFNGRAEVIEVHENRFVSGREHTQTFYDRDWKRLDIVQHGLEPCTEHRDRPECLDEMIGLSEKIAKDMYHARIDWYQLKEKIYFGEITFYDGSGFEVFSNVEDERFLGDLMKLPTDMIK